MDIDYTKQLNAIVRGLSQREAFPAWVITLLSLLVGFILGLVAEPIKAWITGRFRLRQLRKIVLGELTKNIQALDNALKIYDENASNPLFNDREFRNVVQNRVTKSAYEAAQKEIYTYYQLPEQVWIDNFYASLNRLALESNDSFYVADSLSLTSQLVASFYLYVKDRPDTNKIISRVAPESIRLRIMP
jgi:hypothetical protein